MGTSALSKAVPTEVRLHNKTMIMRLLYPDHEMTRADVSRATGLTRMVVSDIVSELIDNKLITEVGFSKPNGPGKRGILLKFDADSRCVVALDLSQPYVFRGAVMESTGARPAQGRKRYLSHGYHAVGSRRQVVPAVD